MEIVSILRLLWRHRLLMVAAALVALVAGYSLAFQVGFPPKLESRQYVVGLASAEALVDTPSSQVVDLGGETGADIQGLAGRATLLASLMTSSPLKDEIARRSGVEPRDLIAVPPAGAAGAAGSPTVSGAQVRLDDPGANILSAKIPTLDSGDVPIITINAQAPDPAVAARLADESVKVLKSYLASVAGTDKVPDARRVVVTELGPARSTVERRGPARMMAIAAALFVFLLGCATIVGVSALVSGWREAAVMEAFPEQEPSDYDEFFANEDAFADDARDEPVRDRASAVALEEPSERGPARHPNTVGF